MKTQLAEFLVAAGLGQSEFADKNGFLRAQVSYWVNGKRGPDRDNAIRLQELTGIPATYWGTLKRPARVGAGPAKSIVADPDSAAPRAPRRPHRVSKRARA